MKTKEVKPHIVKGTKVGLSAFVICYICSLIISIVLNISVLQKINNIVHGALSDKIDMGITSIIKITSIIMNFSVFNTIGNIRVSLLILCVIPCISFIMANRNEEKIDRLNIDRLIVYLTSSVIFSILLSILSLGTKGVLLDVDVNFFSIKNIFITIFITLLIQVVIGMSNNINRISGVRATRIMIRLMLGFGGVIGLIILFILLNGRLGSIFGMLLMIIILLPNMAIYTLFLLMGINVRISEPLLKLINYSNDKLILSFGDLPIFVRVLFILLFVVVICVSLLYLNKKKFLINLGIFVTSFSVFTTLVAIFTAINLGAVKNVVHVQFGINWLQAFLTPFIMVGVIGLIVFLVRKAISIIKEV
jgi:hypothetical protein